MNHHQSESPLSLSDVHRSVRIPDSASRMGRKFLAFGGPAFLVSVGYMDPGNWATDLEGGSRFGYDLLWVLLLSNAMAILLQTLCARLGVVTGRDLAQACHDHYRKSVVNTLWVLSEIAIAACDLAEVLGTAIALNLLFHLPLLYGVIITAGDVLFLLGLQRLGIRKLEGVVLSLIFIVGLSFVIEMFIAQPSVSSIAMGFVPRLNSEMLYVAIGIIGATVMPHNLYLHSALVQTRRFDATEEGKRQANRYNFLDAFIALNGALFVNAGILILAAAVFFTRHIPVTEIQQAHQLLSALVGNNAASILFGVALLASGQSSTITGTLAGQIVMEGFVQLKIRPAFRRIVTRGMAIIPAAIVIAIYGDASSYNLLIFSQVLLSMQLAFAIVPLIHFTSSREKMGHFANAMWVKFLAWLTAAIVIVLNVQLVIDSLQSAWHSDGSLHTVAIVSMPLAIGLAALLLYITFEPWIPSRKATDSALKVSNILTGPDPAPFQRIGIALERSSFDAPALQRAVALAKQRGADAHLVLIHIVTSASTMVFGVHANDQVARLGEDYLRELTIELQQVGISCSSVLGFGRISAEVTRIARDEQLDVLVLGAHGHRGIRDLMYGATVSAVRHALTIPILVVK